MARFRINEHLDLQCRNFERSESVSTSVSSVQLSPKPSRRTGEVEERTSPYFKKEHFTRRSQESADASVVRVLDLGGLAAKLSRRSQKIPEATQEKESDSDSLNSSQKENLHWRREDTKDAETVTTVTKAETSSAPEIHPGSETRHNLHPGPSGPEEKLLSPNQNSFSTFVKRKATFSSKVTGFRKRAKYDRVVNETEETTSPESPTDSPVLFSSNSKDPSSIAAGNLPLCSVRDIDAEEIGVEKNPADQHVDIPQPTRLPYYLQNFCSVLQAVLENEDDRALFDQHDMSHIQAFEKLSGTLKYPSVWVYTGKSE